MRATRVDYDANEIESSQALAAHWHVIVAKVAFNVANDVLGYGGRLAGWLYHLGDAKCTVSAAG